MHFTRARYVTICQQFLVTAAVVAVGLSAAGVMTLQIVAPEKRVPDASSLTPAVQESQAYVATKPVTPKVREVKIAAPLPKAVVKAPTTLSQTVLSQPTTVHGYATVGVTWKPGTTLAENQIKVQVRTEKNGTWSGWQAAAYHDDHGPDGAEAKGDRAERPGTDPVVIGDVDRVQMRAVTTGVKAPADLELAVIDPGATNVVEQPAAIDTSKLPASDATATSAAPISSTAGTGGDGSAATHGDGAAADPSPASGIRLAAMRTAPKPFIFSRAQWGANESLRDKSSLRYGTIKTGFIHHTVNANTYTAEQVPALIRGIYAYHTQSRGWSDIGYNFLVDRFGRIWEGRYGGVDRPVVGAHTLGYNEYAFAMSAIGNYDIKQPSSAMVQAYGALFAWKLSLHGVDAASTKQQVGSKVFRAINGHRDAASTACPGKYLYAKIPEIRKRAAEIQRDAGTPVPPEPEGPGTPLDADISGSAWPDLVVRDRTTNHAVVIRTQGQFAFEPGTTAGEKW
ncbi:MAG: peptidoglycan recognition protein, partial [Marmoricola sp.]